MKISFDEHRRKKQRDEHYKAFDAVCLQKLHMTSGEVRRVFLEFTDDMFEEFNLAFEEGGPDAMWYQMMHRVAALSLLYKQRELPVESPWLDLYEHSLTIGIDLKQLEQKIEIGHSSQDA